MRKIPKTLRKSVSDVISKIKSQGPQISSTTSRLLHGCRQPKSLSLPAADQNLRRRRKNHRDKPESEKSASDNAAGCGPNDEAATLEDIDRFLFENFRSLFCDNNGSDREEEDESETPATFDSSRGMFATPALTPGELCDSHRFFISPGSSGPLIEEARTSRTRSYDVGCVSSTATAADLKIEPTKGKTIVARENCVAVLKASADPFDDFRRSMGEVMEARARHGQRVDWDFMEELLFCYLRLNEKKQYRFVLDAFVDSVLDLRRNSGDGGERGAGRAAEGEGKEGQGEERGC